jgi:hypothetical protein
MMLAKRCAYCNKMLANRRRTYCNEQCQTDYRSGKVFEQIKPRYNQVTCPELERLKSGCWWVFSRYDDEQTCIGEFMRVFKRAPEYVIEENWWRFLGPVFTEEEIARRNNAK